MLTGVNRTLKRNKIFAAERVCREHYTQYRNPGVPYCWVIDPESRRLWEYFADDAAPRPCSDRISAGSVEIPADEAFEDL